MQSVCTCLVDTVERRVAFSRVVRFEVGYTPAASTNPIELRNSRADHKTERRKPPGESDELNDHKNCCCWCCPVVPAQATQVCSDVPVSAAPSPRAQPLDFSLFCRQSFDFQPHDLTHCPFTPHLVQFQVTPGFLHEHRTTLCGQS
jgi:hypothetical protein